MLEKMKQISVQVAADPVSESEIHVKFFCQENANIHQTNKYETVYKEKLVIRRGKPFKMSVSVPNEDFISKYTISLDLSFGYRPSPQKGSSVRLQVTGSEAFTHGATEWDVRRDGPGSEKELVLQVQVPAVIGVGVWTIKTILESQGNNPVEIENDIFILFNPWCLEDTVYMPDENHKNEYILNPNGQLYCGTVDEISPRPWVFGQFNQSILPTCMHLLDLTGLEYNARSNPIFVTRLISNIANKFDDGDKGILVGKWEGDFLGGKSPQSWTGSAKILDDFRNDGVPVKFGQCWVFAGIVTTICRAIGIPARAVTCFNAGHDDDGSMNIDVTLDYEGKADDPKDSVWSYHVWTEVWMKRLDYSLTPEYAGWQVIDGTPQAPSAGAYQLGPCPVLAVKRGEVGMAYDGNYVFSEVNADYVTWILKEGATEKYKTSFSTDYIGKLVITKKVISDTKQDTVEYEDITLNYKYAEGTDIGRTTFVYAIQKAKKTLESEDEPKYMNIEVTTVGSISIGGEFQMSVTIQNLSSQTINVNIILTCSSIYYTGVHEKMIKQERKTETFGPNEQKTVTSELVHSEEYDSSLTEDAMIKIFAVAISEKNEPLKDQAVTGQHIFVVEKPTMSLHNIPNELEPGKTYKLRVVFKNPLNKTLTRCQFSVEAPGLTGYENRNRETDINPEEEVTEEFDITAPTYNIDSTLVAVFTSNELSDVIGSMDVFVSKPVE